MSANPAAPPAAGTFALEELLRRWREEGDLAARGQLLTDSQVKMRGVIRRQLRLQFLDLKTDGGVLTDDAQQTVNAAILAKMDAGKVRPPDSFRGYLAFVREVTFCLLADLRDRFNVPGRTFGRYADGTGANIPDRDGRATDIDHLWELVARLPGELREAVELRHWLGLTFEDIRHVMGLADAAAAWRLIDAAQKQLRQLAGPVGFEG